MPETVPHRCVLCLHDARRQLHVADVSPYVIDCAHCGLYTISVGLDQRSRVFPDRRHLNTVRGRIKTANARGKRLDVDTGLEAALETALD